MAQKYLFCEFQLQEELKEKEQRCHPTAKIT